MTLADPQTSPQGKAEQRDERLLLLLALIDDGDVADAQALWRQSGGDTSLIGIRRDISLETSAIAARLKAATIEFSDSVADKAGTMTTLLYAEQIDLRDWQDQMGLMTKRGTVAMGIVASGNPGQKYQPPLKVPDDPDQAANLAERVAYNLSKLDGFALGIQKGEITDVDVASARAALYAASLNPTYEWSKHVAMGLAGMTQVRNVLHPAEHCTSAQGEPNCTDEAEKGWVTFREMSLPGSRVCRMNCNCSLEYRKP